MAPEYVTCAEGDDPDVDEVAVGNAWVRRLVPVHGAPGAPVHVVVVVVVVVVPAARLRLRRWRRLVLQQRRRSRVAPTTRHTNRPTMDGMPRAQYGSVRAARTYQSITRAQLSSLARSLAIYKRRAGRLDQLGHTFIHAVVSLLSLHCMLVHHHHAFPLLFSLLIKVDQALKNFIKLHRSAAQIHACMHACDQKRKTPLRIQVSISMDGGREGK